MDNIKIKKRLKKYYIVFLPLGIITVVMVINRSKELQEIALFIPIFAISLFWGWVYFDEKYQ
ncbi:hypothetical protein [Pseudalkalibacillus berkeleyi]|uniref:Uncharacterized protein n=1 Tax=Pseudalkalibacillus berkeleyi TaxID=1069813 RepID=A0ABS9H1H3_9BACL|nr:hypothetical protein [Pseudalkalibacillus berkeleyi]MCF6137751.1 hypothetical protein [Pseudalkalibacillus berkeleyi]